MGNLGKAIGIRYFGGYVLYDIPRSLRVGRAHVGVWMGVAVFTAVDNGSRDGGRVHDVGVYSDHAWPRVSRVANRSFPPPLTYVRIQVMSRQGIEMEVPMLVRENQGNFPACDIAGRYLML